MKAILTIILMSISCIGFPPSCKKSLIHHYLIYIDVTDEEHLQSVAQFMPVEFNKVLSHVEKSQGFEHCHGVNLEVRPINDLGNNRGYKAGYAPINPKMTDLQIGREVKSKFAVELRSAIKAVMDSGNNSYKQTRIYEPLCSALKKHSESNRPLTVFIFSDMLEHNKTSFYKKGKTIDIEHTIAKLSKDCHCVIQEDLSFLSIQFISFRTSKNDRSVSNATKFWVDFFESHKATVSFGSSISL